MRTSRHSASRRTLPAFTGRVAAYVLVGAVLVLFTIVIPRVASFELPAVISDTGDTGEGRILDIVSSSAEETPDGRVVTEQVEVAFRGERILIDRTYREGGVDAFEVRPDARVLVTVYETPDGASSYFLRDHVRTVPIWAFSLLFALAVVLVGGWQGAWSLLGLVASFLLILRFIVPGILSGHDPLTIAIAGSLAIMLSTLLLAHGPSARTWIAVGGTAVSLLLTGLLATFAVRAATLSGLASEDAATLSAITEGAIDARGLLLGGIIIGTLGVLDDITTAQSAAVFELRRANRAFGASELYARAMSIGREHIAATANTLVLAYAGASLPLLMILAVQPAPFGILISLESLSTEIVRTLVGSIGLVAAVPITTGLAAVLVGRGLVEARDPIEETAPQEAPRG